MRDPDVTTRDFVEAIDAASPGGARGPEPLLPPEQADHYRRRWHEIEEQFAGRPEESVEEADALVADLMQRLAAAFSQEREWLESRWENGDPLSKQDVAVAVKRYRSFFDRLLSAGPNHPGERP